MLGRPSIRRRSRRVRWTARIAIFATALLCAPVAAPQADGAAADPSGARAYLEAIRPSAELQGFVNATMEELLAGDASLRRQKVRVALIDIPAQGPPRLAGWHGDSPVYPASVIKFVYLMAAYEWRDRGLLAIDADLDRELRAMIVVSSNAATQQVVRRLTDTTAGPRLSPEEYAVFRKRRLRVKEWLHELGVDELHAVHPTYDGGGDIHGRDLQFLEDASLPGSLPYQGGPFHNRLAMTADATAKLLALLATDRSHASATAAEVRERMRRDVRKQGYLAKRIAGGADLRADLAVFSKTGTWGPIFADAGIVRHASGRQLAIAAFVEGKPAYRGPFIAQLTRAAVAHLLPPPGDPEQAK
jgi:beta-lactamase class A